MEPLPVILPGIQCGGDCSESYLSGTVVVLTAEAESGSEFTGWSGGCTGTEGCVVTLNQAQNVVATFSDLLLNPFQLTVSVQDPQVPFIELSLHSEDGDSIGQGQDYVFTNAEGNLTWMPLASDFTNDGVVDHLRIHYDSHDPNLPSRWSLTMATNKLGSNLVPGAYTDAQRAAFADPGHPGLDFSLDSRGCNTVAGTFNVAEAVFDYSSGEPQAILFRGSFEQYCGGASAAIFGSLYFNAMAGDGEGTVTSNVAGIDCGLDCTELYPPGTTVILTATALPGSVFTGWSGAGCSGLGTCSVTMSEAQNVSATFSTTPISTHSLTVTTNGNGTVTSFPPGITCSDDCSEPYPIDTEVRLTATPAQGTIFTGWSGPCEGLGSCQVTMSEAHDVTATFSAIPANTYPLIVSTRDPQVPFIELSVQSEPGDWIGQGQDYVFTNAEGSLTWMPFESDFTNDGLVDHLRIHFDSHDPSLPSRWRLTTATNKLGHNLVPGTYTDAQRAGFADPGHPGLDFGMDGRGCNTVTGRFSVAEAVFDYSSSDPEAILFRGHFEQHCDGASPAIFGDITYNAIAGDGEGRVTSDVSGIDCGADCTEFYTPNTTVTLTATALDGSTFTGWSGEGCYGTGTCTLLMSEARHVWATFSTASIPIPTHSLTVTTDGSGTVTSFPPGITCPNDCTEPFPNDTEVTLMATPAQGAIFTGWSRHCEGLGSCQVTMSEVKDVTATFTTIPANTYTLSVSTQNPQVPFIELSVQSEPGDYIGQGQDYVFTNAEGSLTWMPFASDFTNDGVVDHLRFSYDSDDPNLPSRWSLTTATNKLGSNLVPGTYADAQRAAFADPGHPGLDFSMDGRGCNKVSGNFSVAEAVFDYSSSDPEAILFRGHFEQHCEEASPAMFGDITYNAIAGDGEGRVTSDVSGIDCGADCTEFYTTNTTVILTATALPGSIFTGWTGEGCSGTGTCTLLMSEARQIWATFSKAFALNLSFAGEGNGTVMSTPMGISCSVDCSQDFTNRSEVTLVATPDSGSVFTGWSGACIGMTNCVVSMTQSQSVTATFAQLPELTVLVNGTGSGSVTSNPVGITCPTDCIEKYAQGTVVSLTAVADAGSNFTGWIGGGCSGAATCTVTLAQSLTVTATFGTPTLMSPEPGAVLTDSAVTFAWAANGTAVTRWWVYIGSTLGAHDLHDSGDLGSSLSTTVSNLPTDGRTLFFRLWFYVDGNWEYADFQYTAATIVATPPALTAPVPASTLDSATVDFAWQANGTAVTRWWVYIGSTLGAHDLHDSGDLGSSLSTTVSNLPTDGRALFFRLWFYVDGNWEYADFQYTAATIVATPPALTAPVPASTLDSATVDFAWQANGTAVTRWWVYIGSTLGAHDLHDSGDLGSSLSTTISNLPTDGRALFFRLWFYVDGNWEYADFQYTAATIVATPPALTAPVPASTLDSATVDFAWAANGTAVTRWWVYIGSTLGAHDLHDSGDLGSSLSTTVSNLPTDGRALFFRLWFYVDGNWEYADFQYTAATQ